MLSRVNSTQPSFNGMYIIKGKANRVEAAKDLIIETCDTAVNTMISNLEGRNSRFYKNFDRVAVLDLNEIFTKNQPEVHTLIATNEHVSNIVNYRLTMELPEPDDLEEKIQNLKIQRTPFGVIVQGDIFGIQQGIREKIQELQAKIAPYLEAEKEAKRGNMDLMADFLIDNMRKIKQKLSDVRNLAVVPYGKLNVLNVEDVLKAIKEHKFNFITGEIK